MTNELKACREVFEKWIIREKLAAPSQLSERLPSGSYQYSTIQKRWEGWQAAWNTRLSDSAIKQMGDAERVDEWNKEVLKILKAHHKTCLFNAETNEYGASYSWQLEALRLERLIFTAPTQTPIPQVSDRYNTGIEKVSGLPVDSNKQVSDVGVDEKLANMALAHLDGVYKFSARDNCDELVTKLILEMHRLDIELADMKAERMKIDYD